MAKAVQPEPVPKELAEEVPAEIVGSEAEAGLEAEAKAKSVKSAAVFGAKIRAEVIADATEEAEYMRLLQKGGC